MKVSNINWMLDAYTVAWGEPTLLDFARTYWHWQNTLANLDKVYR